MQERKSLGSINPRPSGAKPQNAGGQRHTEYSVPSANQFVNKSLPQQSSGSGLKKSLSNNRMIIGKSDVPEVNAMVHNFMREFIDVLKSIVGNFATFNDDVVEKNLKLASRNGLPADDRIMPFECARYLMANLAVILMGLVLDKSFKQTFLDAINIEVNIDKQPPERKKEIRASMKDKKNYDSSAYIIFGVSMFAPDIEDEFMKSMYAGFDALAGYADEFDNEVSKFTPEQKAEYGFIFSNFMYLIRAFTHNDMFMSYVITVIERVKEIMNVKR